MSEGATPRAGTLQADVLRAVLGNLFDELVSGPGEGAAFMLNPGDPGLLASLEQLSAAQASARPANGGASVAAHVDHLRYGLDLLVRWNRGEEPFGASDYAASWDRQTVTDAEWRERLDALRRQATDWREELRRPRDLGEMGLSGIISSIAHLGYHFGAIRQIARGISGPRAAD